MLTIRLRRQGKKKQPQYRIVVAPSQAPIFGKYLEMLGTYNPFTKAVVLDGQKALDWMSKGAKPSNRVARIFQKEGLKHSSIVIKKFRAISKKELETQKAQEETEKAKIQAEKEKAKAAFEEKVEKEKAAQQSSEEKLHQAAEESIQEDKTEGKAEVKKEEEKPAVKKETEVSSPS